MKYNKVAVGLALACITLSNESIAENIVDESIETIVVSGQKIDRSIQETPNSVAVLTNSQIERLNVQNVADIYNVIPNVSGDFNQGFTIRGINAFNVSGGGNSFLTSMYLDGAPLPFRVVRSGALSVWDMSQVEVFRGPQSTLQGRNALAGAIMLRTQDPSYEYSAKGKLTVGEHGQQEMALAAGGALVDDLLAFRIAFEDKSVDGDIDNITRGEEQDDEDNQTLRAKLLFQPNDSLEALLTVTSTDAEYGPRWVLFDYGQNPYEREVWNNSHIYEKTETDLYNLEVSWDIDDQWSFESVTTFSDSDYRYNWDGDMTAVQVVEDNRYFRTDKTTSQEFRLIYQSDDIQAVAGVYMSKLEVDDQASGERFIAFSDLGLPPLDILLTAPAALGGFGLPPEVANLVVPMYPDIDPVILGLDSSLEQEVESLAIYTDITWQLSDKIDVLAGLRYDHEDQKNGSYASYSINNQLPDESQLPQPLNQIVAGINGTLNGMAADASGIEPLADADFDAWLPKIGASYHFDENMTMNFIYQRGYRSGGVGTNIAKQEIYTYDPEYTDNYELSFRSVWNDGKLMINSNLFYTQWSDQQISIQLSTASFDTETINAGESNIKGFEVEMFYYPTNALSIVAGVGFAKTEFDKFDYIVQSTGEIKDLAGRTFEDSPEWTANIAVNYDFDNGFTVGANANYKDESYAYLDPQTSLDDAKLAIDSDPKNDSRTLINVNMAYEWDNYQVRLDVRNLLDEDYISGYFFEADNLSNADSYGQHLIGRSRQISLSFLAEF